jgi:hypothetical protein
MGGQYILDDKGDPVPCDDVIVWAQWFENMVARDSVGDSTVSTVFLALDHSFGEGPPLLYETLVFGGPMAEEMERYSTRQEAEAGHKEMLAKVKGLRAEGD